MILLLDGGISTYLQSLPDAPPFTDRKLWSSSLLLTQAGRDAIQRAHLDFLLVGGSDILTTVTYQLPSSSCHIKTWRRKFQLEEEDDDNEDEDGSVEYSANQLRAMFSDAIMLANRARHDIMMQLEKEDRVEKQRSIITVRGEKFIVVSLGCFGAVLANGSEYTGEYGDDNTCSSNNGCSLMDDVLLPFHQERWEWVMQLNQPIDGVAFETIPSYKEVQAILTMLLKNQQEKEVLDRDDCFVWLSLACKDSNNLNDGTPLTMVLDYIKEVDPDGVLVHGIGVNCCKIKYVHDLSEKIARHIIFESSLNNGHSSPRIVVLYPNSGEEWDDEKKAWLDGTGCTNSEDFAMEVMKCIRNIHDICDSMNREPLGIFIGGCCRTTPKTIGAIQKALDEYLIKF